MHVHKMCGLAPKLAALHSRASLQCQQQRSSLDHPWGQARHQKQCATGNRPTHPTWNSNPKLQTHRATACTPDKKRHKQQHSGQSQAGKAARRAGTASTPIPGRMAWPTEQTSASRWMAAGHGVGLAQGPSLPYTPRRCGHPRPTPHSSYQLADCAMAYQPRYLRYGMRHTSRLNRREVPPPPSDRSPRAGGPTYTVLQPARSVSRWGLATMMTMTTMMAMVMMMMMGGGRCW